MGMMKLASKKNVKIISVGVAAVFVLGMVALGVTQLDYIKGGGTEESAIGVVEYKQLVTQAPGVAQVSTTLQGEIATMKKEIDEKSKTLSQADQEKLKAQYRTKIMTREKELIKPVLENLNKAIDKVAEKRGLAVIVDRSCVLYGGLDVNSDVRNELKKK